jgi:hypothetical protein
LFLAGAGDDGVNVVLMAAAIACSGGMFLEPEDSAASGGANETASSAKEIIRADLICMTTLLVAPASPSRMTTYIL